MWRCRRSLENGSKKEEIKRDVSLDCLPFYRSACQPLINKCNVKLVLALKLLRFFSSGNEITSRGRFTCSERVSIDLIR